MKEVPKYPTTEELQRMYPYSDEENRLADRRWRVSQILEGYTEGLVAIVGPCAMTDNSKLHQDEAAALAELDKVGVTSIYRAPIWKPRTDPNAWHGLETTDPETAYRTLVSIAHEQSSAAIELGMPHHVGRYASMLAFGWIGSRNVRDSKFINSVAKQTPNMPLGIKNRIDGNIDDALMHIENKRTDSNAPVVLLFRGGEELKSPDEWEEMYKYAYEQTDGSIIVDVAHGSEMAHDPTGRFKKSAEGQKEALEHVIDLARRHYAPKGIMIEAGYRPDLHKSPTDPLMPLDIALEGVKRLAKTMHISAQETEAELNPLRIPVAT